MCTDAVLAANSNTRGAVGTAREISPAEISSRGAVISGGSRVRLGAASEFSPAEISRQGAAVTAVSGGNRVGVGAATEAGAATRSGLPFAAKAVAAEEEGATLREISASIATDWNGVAIKKINK